MSSPRKSVNIRLYYDYKSPYSFLAKDQAYQLERDYPGVTVEWLPFPFNVEQSFQIPGSRDDYHWRKVKVGYSDARRWANDRLPKLTLLGPQKVFDSTLAMFGALYCMQRSKQTFDVYNHLVYDKFFKRQLDIENVQRMREILGVAARSVFGPSVTSEQVNEVRLWTDEFVKQAKEILANPKGTKNPRMQRLAEIRQQADKDQVFGVPSFIVEGELFFGNDRVDWVRKKLERELGFVNVSAVMTESVACHQCGTQVSLRSKL